MLNSFFIDTFLLYLILLEKQIKDSLKIINSKSQQLLHFIDSYRQIAELPKPKKSRINLRNSIEKVLKIFEPEFKIQNIKLDVDLQDFFVQPTDFLIWFFP